jgi:FAD/FMN-containing dehydrogenase
MSTTMVLRRRLLRLAAFVTALPGAAFLALHPPAALGASPTRRRVRPGDADWPTPEQWQRLAREVGGAFLEPRSPVKACVGSNAGSDCQRVFESLKNPYAISDDPALTQTLGWVGAWTSQPSAYAVAARRTADVVAAVNFAREHRLRLVVKGGGHSYQGTSNAPDSLLVWTRRLNDITLHEHFVADGCQGEPVRAVTLGAGTLWGEAYDAVTTRAGGYVQGGGCLSVGVAGLVQSGGFGSFSKAFGLAAGSLLQAEVVTADGAVRTANACTNPDLFWALKGGGGGTFGIVTRLTLKVHPLPETFGAVSLKISASSAEAYRKLIGLMVDFYAKHLFNPHWGEQIRVRPNNELQVSMVFQGLSRAEAAAVWQPFFEAIDAAPDDFRMAYSPFRIIATSARSMWDGGFLKKLLGVVKSDDRPNAPPTNLWWTGDGEQAGQVLHGYQSMWLPAALLGDGSRAAFADALFAASRQWGVSLHVNKGLAGATPEAIAGARDTAMNPAVLDAFALAISGGEGPPAYPGVPGHEPDAARAKRHADGIARAMAPLRQLVPGAGAYVSESNFFEPDWQQAFWGRHHARLASVKASVDPDGLFFTHHGVGSEAWSADGFTRVG